MSRPIRPDEEELRLVALTSSGRVWPGELANSMHHRRLDAILQKWEGKGWWDCGVSTRSGWLTPEGWIALKSWFRDLPGEWRSPVPGGEDPSSEAALKAAQESVAEWAEWECPNCGARSGCSHFRRERPFPEEWWSLLGRPVRLEER